MNLNGVKLQSRPRRRSKAFAAGATMMTIAFDWIIGESNRGVVSVRRSIRESLVRRIGQSGITVSYSYMLCRVS